MIEILGTEFIPRLGNGRPENGTGTFVEALMYWALSSAGFLTDNSLYLWPRLFVAGRLDNIPRIIALCGVGKERQRNSSQTSLLYLLGF